MSDTKNKEKKQLPNISLLFILFKKQAHICTRKRNEVLTKDKSQTPFKNHNNF